MKNRGTLLALASELSLAILGYKEAEIPMFLEILVL